MKSSALSQLAQASERMLLADLAALAKLSSEDSALEAACQREEALARAATAVTLDDMGAAVAAAKAREAAEKRASRFAEQRLALKEPLEAARQAALAAHGRERAIAILQSRASIEEQAVTARREEAELFGVAAARRAEGLKRDR